MDFGIYYHIDRDQRGEREHFVLHGSMFPYGAINLTRSQMEDLRDHIAHALGGTVEPKTDNFPPQIILNMDKNQAQELIELVSKQIPSGISYIVTSER